MSSEFIKVTQGDASKQNIDIKGIKPINNIKIIRSEEESDSSYSSSESDFSDKVKKKVKTVLRKKEKIPEQPRSFNKPNHDFSMFSNPKKISHRQEETESEYTDESSEIESEYSGSEEEVQPKNDFEERQKVKQDLLIKISALEKKGFEFSKKFTMSSNYEEMLFEYNKIKSFIETQAGVKFARRCLMACVTGIEFLNKKFDPFNIKLEGWSENVMESVDDYDNIFERLHEKYSQKAEVAPEIELLLMLGGSAFMFHLTNSLLKGPMMSNLVAQNNPNFMASMMGAMSQGMKESAKPPPPQAMPQQNKFPAPMETRGMRREMRGPTIDQNLFNGTNIASNYPMSQPPPQMNRYYDENPINDEDRFSIISDSASDISSVSLGSTVKTLNIPNKKGKKVGLELNIK